MVCAPGPPGGRHIGRTVVAHDPFDGDAALREPGDCSLDEPDCGVGLFVGEDLDVGHAAGVVDAHVDGFPSGALGVVTGSSAGDMVAWFVETAELFDVNVDEFAWVPAAVSVWRFNGVEARQAVEADPFEHGAHC